LLEAMGPEDRVRAEARRRPTPSWTPADFFPTPLCFAFGLRTARC
jgi:hypothetical protein